MPNTLGVGRGLAIVAVIYGHALAPWVIDTQGWFSDAAFQQWKLGASFLMAFFFFLSGLAWRENTPLKDTLRQTLTLIFIAWSAAVLVEAVRLGLTWANLASMFGEEPSSLWRFFKNSVRAAVLGDYYAMATMWFLTALGLVRLIAAVTTRLGMFAVAAALVLLIAAGLFTTFTGGRNFYQIAPLGVAFASFIVGHSARGVFHALERKPGFALVALALAGVGLIGSFDLNQGCPLDPLARCGLPWMGNEFSVALNLGLLGNLPLFVFTAAAGIVFMTTLSILLARFGGAAAWRLAAWGRNTVALLVVNGAYLEWAHPLVARWVAPHVPAEGPFFFLTLLASVLVLNLAVAAMLHRPLKAWFTLAMKLGAFAVEAPQRIAAELLAPRRDRVSEVRE